MANNKKCIICGKAYSYCSNCKKYGNQPKWKMTFDTENCKAIFEVAKQITDNAISKEEAKEILGKLDLSQKDNFPTSIKNAIESIVDNETEEEMPVIEEEEVSAIEEPVEIMENETEEMVESEEEVSEEISEDEVDENTVEESNRKRHRRKK